ncbi:MAG: hypothetical protein O3A87_08330 [Verrucomicrobia bacterium]|nr:hypothetical protein [Verrucomicrobiota bacterium]
MEMIRSGEWLEMHNDRGALVNNLLRLPYEFQLRNAATSSPLPVPSPSTAGFPPPTPRLCPPNGSIHAGDAKTLRGIGKRIRENGFPKE